MSDRLPNVADPIAAAARHRCALRYALRELRGGLRGFYVFIACIALGVMAIAGVGSVAASLGEGLAREGRTLLGGDVAFSLIQREAKPDEVAFLRSRGEVSVAATCAHGAHRRRPARAGRTQGGRRRLSDARRADARSENADRRSAGRARRRVRRRGRSDPAGAARSQDRRPRQRSAARPFRSAASSTPSRTSSPAASASVRASWSAKPACAPPGCCSPAAWCAGSTG